MKCTCGTNIPKARLQMGYKNCTQCSTTDKYGVVNIIYHKTGNTVQVMDRKTAEEVNKLGDRKRFGSVLKRSTGGGYNPKKTKTGCSTSIIGSESLYNEVGEKAMLMFEVNGLNAALSVLDKAVKDCCISDLQSAKLKRMFTALEYSI